MRLGYKKKQIILILWQEQNESLNFLQKIFEKLCFLFLKFLTKKILF